MSATGSDDAQAAGLRYSSDDEPGISRRKAGDGVDLVGVAERPGIRGLAHRLRLTLGENASVEDAHAFHELAMGLGTARPAKAFPGAVR